MSRRKKRLPIAAVCRNCGTQLEGAYCHRCGQYLFAGMGQPISHLIGQMLENAFALDRKAPRTLVCLFTRPGKLSAEYRQGHINRYVHPVKLFWMVVLIFVALLTVVIRNNIKEERKESAGTEVASKQAAADSVSSAAQSFAAVQDVVENSVGNALAASIQPVPKEDIDRYTREREKVADFLFAYLPYALVAVIPLFGLVLWLFFLRKRYYYMYHLTFAVHYHTFLLLLYSILLLTEILLPDWRMWGWLICLFLAGPLVYFVVAAYRFYGPMKKRALAWKTLLIGFLYFTLLIILMVAFALIVAYRVAGKEAFQ